MDRGRGVERVVSQLPRFLLFLVLLVAGSSLGMAEERSVCIGTGSITATEFSKGTAYSAAKKAIAERGFPTIKDCKYADIAIHVGAGDIKLGEAKEASKGSYIYLIVSEFKSNRIFHTHGTTRNNEEVRSFIMEHVGFILDNHMETSKYSDF